MTVWTTCFILGMALLAPRAHAQSPSGACGPYEVAFYQFGSFLYKNDDGKYVGIDKDVIDEVVARTGCDLQGVVESRARTWVRLKAGNLAMTVSAIETPERLRYLDFFHYIKVRNWLLIRSETAKGVNSLQDFNARTSLRLAVVKTFKHGRTIDLWVDELRKQGRVDEYVDPDTVARIVSLGKADAFLSEPVIWEPILRANNLKGNVQVFDWFPQDTESAGIAIARGRLPSDDSQRIKQALLDMRRDGTLERILSRYMSKREAAHALP